MESIGNKIAELRKANNLTQAELGEKLNISAQAVSKWEKNLSEPDLSTLNKLCDIFGVTLDEIAGNDAKEEKKEVAATLEAQPAVTKVLFGHCSKCHKPLYSRNEYTVRDYGDGSQMICNKCLQKEKIDRKAEDDKEERISFKWGLIIGIPVSIILFIICLVADSGESIGARIGLGVALLYVSFVFILQLSYSELIQDIMDFFRKSFNMPLIIWELSFDGFIRMILTKWLLGLLLWALSTLIFLIGGFITACISAFTFPFTLVAYFKTRKKEALEINQMRERNK